MKKTSNSIVFGLFHRIRKSSAIKISFFLLFLTIVQVKAKSQDTLNSFLVEQKSYQLYQDKKWTELVSFGNKAVKQGYDYFYLKLRIGIACFEKKNYCLAEFHFKKALRFSSNDELTKEYLYYCYLYTGRTEDARMLSRQFGKELGSKIGTDKLSAIGFAMFEGGTKISDSTYYYDKSKKNESIFFNPATYFQLGLEHGIKKRVSVFHVLTYFNQKNFVGSLQQIQYYLKAGVPIKNNWLISPSFHYVNINFSSEITTTTTDTLWPPGMPHIQPPPGAPPLRTTTNTSVSTFKTNSNYFIGSLAVQKIVKNFTFSVGSTISNMSNKTQYINSASLYYSMLGNSKVVLGCTGYAHTIDNYKTTYISASPFIYIQPSNKIAVKLSYLSNVGNNIIEDNGYFVNNSPDLTKSRWSILVNFHASKSISLYATYQLENKQENIQQFNYRYNIIVAGIKIKL